MENNANSIAIRVDDLSFHYGDKNVLQHVTMEIKKGSF